MRLAGQAPGAAARCLIVLFTIVPTYGRGVQPPQWPGVLAGAAAAPDVGGPAGTTGGHKAGASGGISVVAGGSGPPAPGRSASHISAT